MPAGHVLIMMFTTTMHAVGEKNRNKNVEQQAVEIGVQIIAHLMVEKCSKAEPVMIKGAVLVHVILRINKQRYKK